jgi:hypothetical protein
MPLKKGHSRRSITENIRDLLHKYKRDGWIGRSRPAGMKQAVKQAAAIAYETARRSQER